MKRLQKLLMILLMVILGTTSLLSQNLDCSPEREAVDATQKQLNECNRVLGKVYKHCKDQLHKDKNVIRKQGKLIKDLEKDKDKDAMKHRAQGAGGTAILFILLIIFL